MSNSSKISAAVYHVTTNQEARLFFKLEPSDNVNPMQNLYHYDGIVTNSIDVGILSSNTPFIIDIEHKNTGFNNYAAIIYFIIECDEGIRLKSHTSMGNIIYDGIEDFNSITYKHPDSTAVECDMSHIEVMSPSKIKITPIPDDTLFQSETSRFSLLTLDFNEMSYGNYIVTCYT